MPKLHFIQFNGSKTVVDAEVGKTVMQTAVDNMVPGIVGDCGGCCSCATCHGYVAAEWVDKIPPASEDETMMLDGALNVESNSRLTCQINMREDLDGLVIHLPESQY